jgi:predicted ester cyclase
MKSLVLFASLALPGGGPAAPAQSNLPLAPVTAPKLVTRASTLTEPQAAQLLRTARLFYTFWNTGDVRYARASVSADFKDNTLPPGRPQGLPGLQPAAKNLLAAVPDLKCTLEDVVLANDKVVARLLFTGHNTGPLGTHPASGKAIHFLAIDILHIRNGKIYEDWHLEDNLTFRQQIGLVKP